MIRLVLFVIAPVLFAGCMGIADIVHELGKDPNSVRIKLYNPLYGSLEVERNLACPPPAPRQR